METQRQCAHCYARAGGNGLCITHSRRRLTMLRAARRRREARIEYTDRLATLAGQGRDHVLDDGDVIARPTVSLREVV